MTTNRIVLGKIYGHFGVKGWVNIVSYTRPFNQIFQYAQWTVGWHDPDKDCSEEQQCWMMTKVSAFKQHPKGAGRGWVVKLAGYDDREASKTLIGRHIGIDRSRLEPLPEGDYYWLDLIGLSVVNLEGVVLGKIDHLLETGANDVMVVHSVPSPAGLYQRGMDKNTRTERLLPWTSDVVTRVDLDSGVMTVDWQEDY